MCNACKCSHKKQHSFENENYELELIVYNLNLQDPNPEPIPAAGRIGYCTVSVATQTDKVATRIKRMYLI